MRSADAVVIGGGLLGCFTARNLRRWQIDTLLVEAEDDICTGITRANSAIVYPGYDNKPGSRKAEMTVRGNAGFEALCTELEVPFSRCGSLLVTYDENAVGRLRKKLEQGRENGVPGLRLLSGAEAEAMEPMLQPGVAAALWAPSAGTVNPWQLGIAACENAVQNGCTLLRGTKVTAIQKTEPGYLLETDREPIACRVVLNCAGLHADQVQELLAPPSVRLQWDGADYLVLDPRAKQPSHILFQQASACGKGITAIPCTEGNLLLSGFRRPLESPFSTTAEGLESLHAAAKALLPTLQTDLVIRSFGAVRPNPCTADGESLHDFCIEHPADGFWSLIGIKTPGLTCANELGTHLAEAAADYLSAAVNPAFDPHRPAIRSDDTEILCLCGQITRGAVLQAIARGAVTVDGVKRRVGTGMGRCQGSRCAYEIQQLLNAHSQQRGAL